MKKLTEQKWFIWITKYWFFFPIIGFLLLMAAVFFGYGERSYIGVHDNMDLFLAQFQMLKNTDSFWKHGVDVPFLGGVSRDNLPSELSLYSLLFMIFPSYTAYVLGLFGKVLIGMFSFRLLAGELLCEKFLKYRPAVYMTGFAYGICWFFPAFGFAFASIPLCVWLLIKIYRGQGKRWYLWYVALSAYPLVSYFSYHGIFILGYLALAILWLFCRKDKGAAWRLTAALFVLAFGFVVCEYRLFGQMLFGEEVTIRSSIVNASLSLPEILGEIVQVFREGIFHADGVHGKIVLPVCLLCFVVNNALYIRKKQGSAVLRDPFNLLLVFILFNCVVYGLYDFEPLRSLVEKLIPPLEGWQFNRTIFFNPFLWYAALFLVLRRLYDAGIWQMWLANAVVCIAVLAVILSPTRYNDLYSTCYNRAYEHFHGQEVDELSYEQFYAVALARASFLGLTNYHSAAHMLRAVFEGVAFSHKVHIDRLLSARTPPEIVRMAGGAARSPVWVQMFADVLGLPVQRIAGVRELGALGSAIAASVAAGLYPGYDQAVQAMVRTGEPVWPDPAAHAVYLEKFETYQAISAAMDTVWDRFKV